MQKIRRIMARLIDLIIVCFISGILIDFSEMKVLFIFWFAIVFLIYEIVSLSIWKCTFGKFVFGISLFDTNDEKLEFETILFRSMEVFIYGLGCLIPFLSAISVAISLYFLKSDRNLKWDTSAVMTFKEEDAGTTKLKSIVTISGFIGILLIAFISRSALASTEKEEEKPAQLNMIFSSFVNIYELSGGDLLETIARGDVPEMLQSYNDGIPDFGTAAREKLRAYDDNEDYEGGIQFLEEIDVLHLELSPEDNNEVGHFYLNAGAYDEAIVVLEKGLAGAFTDEIKDALLVNLSYCYLQTYNYDLAIKHGEEALKYSPNDYYDYINIADAYLSLNNYDKAIENYNKIVEIGETSSYVTYQMGVCYYNLEDYNAALEYFSKYNKDEKDYMGVIFEAYARQKLEQPYSNYKEMVINQLDDIDSIEWLYDALDLFLEANDETSIEVAIEKGLLLDPDATELYQYMIYALLDQNKIDQIQPYILKIVNSIDVLSERHQLKGELLNYASYNQEAINSFEDALKLDANNTDAAYGQLIALTDLRDFNGVEQWEQRFLKLVPLGETYWHLASAYYELRDFEKAYDYYDKAYEENSENPDFLSEYSGIQFENGNLEQSDSLLEAAIDNGLDEDISAYKKMISDSRLSEGKQLVDFYNAYYLYGEDQPLDQTTTELLSEKSHLTGEDLKMLWDNSLLKDDPFSFYIADEDYQYFLEMEEETTVHSQMDPQGNYIVQIDYFTEATDREFYQWLQTVTESEDKNLIIDLRNNPGGDAKSGFEILDYLLPYSETGEMKDRNGDSYYFYSDFDQITFKNIVVWMNKDSASCSEIIALGLNEYLDNVTLIGEQSYGKGVAQSLFYGTDNTWVSFIVTDYWNIKGINIQDRGITPELKVEQDLIENYQSLTYPLF